MLFIVLQVVLITDSHENYNHYLFFHLFVYFCDVGLHDLDGPPVNRNSQIPLQVLIFFLTLKLFIYKTVNSAHLILTCSVHAQTSNPYYSSQCFWLIFFHYIFQQQRIFVLLYYKNFMGDSKENYHWDLGMKGLITCTFYELDISVTQWNQEQANNLIVLALIYKLFKT